MQCYFTSYFSRLAKPRHVNKVYNWLTDWLIIVIMMRITTITTIIIIIIITTIFIIIITIFIIIITILIIIINKIIGYYTLYSMTTRSLTALSSIFLYQSTNRLCLGIFCSTGWQWKI